MTNGPDLISQGVPPLGGGGVKQRWGWRKQAIFELVW